MKNAKLPLAVILVLLLAMAGAGFWVVKTAPSPPRLFRRNAVLKAEGYYMAEFEFKMMAALLQLNEGSYWRAYQTLRRINNEMQTMESLPRIPRNASPEELTAFMLERQYPETGAFMDPRYPFWTYVGPTANALDYLETLSRQTGQPVKLKYPLRFLDQIAETDRLRDHLDSVLYFREIWADKFEGPSPFVLASELSPDSIDLFERIGGYRFSEEWKRALRDWFYEAQDPTTGFWGARIGDERRWRQALDIDSTSHILKHFLTDRGEARDAKYPLRHSEQLARTLLKEAEAPVPDGADAQHEWSLRQFHAARIIAHYLWPTLSAPLREQALRAMRTWMEHRFSLYRPADGGFAVDASSGRADIDSTSTSIAFLRQVGAIPGTWERERLRGRALAAGPRTGAPLVLAATEQPLAAASRLATHPALDGLAKAVNSIRVYRDSAPPSESWDDSNLLQIAYPADTRILDIIDVRQRLWRFLAAEGGEYGNWSSKARLRQAPLGFDRGIREVPVTRGWPDLLSFASRNPKPRRLILVGLDAFQVPVFELEVRRELPKPEPPKSR